MVSRWEIVALSVNDVIGSGVYLILPVAAAQLLGAASIWAILAAGVAVLLLVLCFAEAGSLFDGPGGAYVYTRAAFGEFVGFEVGWMTWIARIASIAGLSVFFARAVGYLWDGANHGPGQALTIVLPLLALTWINVLGIKSGARTAVVLALGKTPAARDPVRGRGLCDHLESRVPGADARQRELHEGGAARSLRVRRLREHGGAGGRVREPAA